MRVRHLGCRRAKFLPILAPKRWAELCLPKILQRNANNISLRYLVSAAAAANLSGEESYFSIVMPVVMMTLSFGDPAERIWWKVQNDSWTRSFPTLCEGNLWLDGKTYGQGGAERVRGGMPMPGKHKLFARWPRARGEQYPNFFAREGCRKKRTKYGLLPREGGLGG